VPSSSEDERDALRAQLAEAREEARIFRMRFAKSQANVKEARQRLHWFRVHLTRTLAAARTRDVPDLSETPPTSREYRPVLAGIEKTYAMTRMVDELRRGRPLDESAVATVRDLVAANDLPAATSLAQALAEAPETDAAGRVGRALIASEWALHEIAWRHIRGLPVETLLRTMPAELVDLGFQHADAEGRAACAAVAASAPGVISDADWWGAARAAYAHGAHDAARDLLDSLAERSEGAPALDERDAEAFAWLRDWIARAARLRSGRPPAHRADAVPFGLLTYRSPDRFRSSTNLGDHVQTLAMLGHLTRHTGIDFGEDPLGRFATSLASRMPAEHRLTSPDARVSLHPIERDDSTVADIPDGTWAIVFGWFMLPVFDERYGMPMDERIRPFFVSFHVNRRELLTGDAVDYLRRHAPIGCRDWTTVHLLQGLGVPAFFSGCLTTTVNLQYGDLSEVPQRAGNLPTGVVDLTSAEFDFTGDGAWVRSTPVRPEQVHTADVENLEAAVAELQGYREGCARIATSRLHSYLPAIALGLEVDFRPRRLSDVRFDGLLGLTPGAPALRAMQEGIGTKLAGVVGAILEGAAEDEVRAVWRAACADDVAAADRRLRDLPEFPPPGSDVASICRTIRQRAVAVPAARPRWGDPVHVAFSLDGAFVTQLPVVVESIVSTTRRPVSFWVTERDVPEADLRDVAADFPEASFTFLPCDGVDYGDVRGMLPHIATLAVMDRLLLPVLLAEVPRCVFHDLDAVTLADIGTLADLELGGAPLAARRSEIRGSRTVLDHAYRAADRLDDPEVSAELRRRVHARVPGDPPSFNAGVMVLDLQRMRDDRFTDRFIPWVERYGLNDQELLCCYAGRDVAPLGPEWNFWTKQDDVADPKLIHFAGPVKPWDDQFTNGAEHWHAADARWRARRAARCASQSATFEQILHEDEAS
jgi:lipopolysaccharide biosynthesis glycosyltransferase